jgi:hypothetical protein
MNNVLCIIDAICLGFTANFSGLFLRLKIVGKSLTIKILLMI